ncbi:FMN-binding negative transcriptional regulator [Rhodovulum sp. DZ06]|uniref:FMN-binding negative transcriptional regulator n=1 Tax=Rhodovulum sp. DZ06 TaxID=3425126 RepID=UPI003D3386E6
MYIPDAFEMPAEDAAAMLAAGPLATLVTAGPEGPEATPLPLLFDPTDGPKGALLGHFARANPHWKTAAGPNGLALIHGAETYVTPSWYAAKAEHGKVVPTWNYELVQVRGGVETFDDPERLLALVTRLTELHEGPRDAPWAVSDAPARFIAAQLRGIVGMRLGIESIRAKRKMSQNKPAADLEGVRAGLAAEGKGWMPV